jgi:hypothetical protein
MSSSWYKVVNEAELEQGDIFRACPINRILVAPSEEANELTDVYQEEHDVIVLTQTCDLVNSKVDEVLVALVVGYKDLAEREKAKNPKIIGKDFRKAAVDTTLVPYLLLQNRIETPTFPWSLVDFHNLFSIPKSFLTAIAANAGERLRLESPYKEHLAQGFGNYMMRVALPIGLKDFENELP